ncbi:MAG: hypothetical protein D6784_08435 [Chloroflexi bacterium]|nr:MAG: hypothetical protein D6784_08435 [Chloroflexota bacterium]
MGRLALLWVLLAFLSGSFPFAVWLGRLWTGKDVRTIGDGNPGGTNAWKLGGWRLGAIVLVLDFLKAALPVAVAGQVWQWNGGWLVAVAVAPVLGHAFSPFLRGRGGKGLAAAFGVWAGLTLAEGPLVMGLAMALSLKLRLRDGWAVVAGLLILLVYGLARGWSPDVLLVWRILFAWLVWAYRGDLARFPVRRETSNG